MYGIVLNSFSPNRTVRLMQKDGKKRPTIYEEGENYIAETEEISRENNLVGFYETDGETDEYELYGANGVFRPLIVFEGRHVYLKNSSEKTEETEEKAVYEMSATRSIKKKYREDGDDEEIKDYFEINTQEELGDAEEMPLFIPPFSDTANIEEIYDIKKLLSLKMLRHAKKLACYIEEGVVSERVIEICNEMRENKWLENKEKEEKAVLALDVIEKLIHSKSQKIQKYIIAKTTHEDFEDFLNWIFDEFLVDGILSQENKQRLICIAIVLLLYLFEWQIELQTVVIYLGLGTSQVVMIAKLLGCSAITQNGKRYLSLSESPLHAFRRKQEARQKQIMRKRY